MLSNLLPINLLFFKKYILPLDNKNTHTKKDDIVFVECMDRLGRNGDDLDEIVKYLLKKGVQINFVREGFFLGKEDNPMSKLTYDVMKSFINFYSRLSKERRMIGIQKAKKEGKYKGRKKLASEKIILLNEQIKNTRKTKVQIAKEFGISRRLVYKYMEK